MFSKVEVAAIAAGQEADEDYMDNYENNDQGATTADSTTSTQGEVARIEDRAPDVAYSGNELLCQTISMAEVEPKEVRWLWPGRIPLGKVALLEGDPGLGKSTVTMDIAARVTTGTPMPFASAGREPGNVLVLTCEDDLADTVRPRLDAAGADNSRVLTINLDALDRFPTLPSRMRDLEEVIVQREPKLVIIDPLMAFVDAGIDTKTDHHVRRVMRPLGEAARRTSAAILVVRHLNKATGQTAIQRGGGSMGIAGAARAVLLVGKDPDDSAMRILAHSKINVAQESPAVRFKLMTAPNGVGRVAWVGECDVAADRLVGVEQQSPRRQSEVDRAAAFLQEVLADGPVPAEEVKELATAREISPTGALERAKDLIGVKSRKRGEGWFWGLPAEDADLADLAHLDQEEGGQPEQGGQAEHDDDEDGNF